MSIECSNCGKQLTGGLDTFGDISWPHCAECTPEPEEPRVGDSWYGLAPHHHDMSRTGSIIGSTVFDELPTEHDSDGTIIIKPGLRFWPDIEAPGCGTYEVMVY